MIYLILFVVTVAGGMLFFLIPKNNEQFLKLFWSFSGAYLFTITVLHLFPEVYSIHEADGILSTRYIGFFVLIGFLFQVLLEQFSSGVEHGHSHVHDNPTLPLGIIISLGLHSFLEGMPLSENMQTEELYNPLLTGILLHKIPEAVTFTGMLIASRLNKSKVIVYLLFFAMITPLGALFSLAVQEIGIIADIQFVSAVSLAFVIGLFLHVSTTILFESSESHHHFGIYKLIAIVFGLLLGGATLLW